MTKNTALETITRLEARYSVLCRIESMHWGMEQEAELARLLDELHAAYDVVGTDDFDRIAI